jgi:intracellular sulfur oxidation DsrE/DsrF family protein
MRLRAPIAFLFALALGACAGEPPPAASAKIHRLAVQVSVNDPAQINLALNNVANVAKHYGDLGQEVEIEIVAYGPGLHMLREDTSPVKARVKSIAESVPGVTFMACQNTVDNMTKAEGKPVPVMKEAKSTPTGVARLMELQENGWSYVRP